MVLDMYYNEVHHDNEWCCEHEIFDQKNIHKNSLNI